jgi:predicted CopG family antitoxin
METKTIRIHSSAYRQLLSLTSDWETSSLADTVDRLLEQQRRRDLLDRMNEAFAALRRDQAAWDEWQTDIAELDGTLEDGLLDEPVDPDSGSAGSSEVNVGQN